MALRVAQPNQKNVIAKEAVLQNQALQVGQRAGVVHVGRAILPPAHSVTSAVQFRELPPAPRVLSKAHIVLTSARSAAFRHLGRKDQAARLGPLDEEAPLLLGAVEVVVVADCAPSISSLIWA